MKKLGQLGAVCAVLFVSIASLDEVQANLVPISSNLSINGASNLDSNTANPDPTTVVSDSQGTTVNPLNVSYTRTLDNGVETITETGTANATWTDTSAASIAFDMNLSSSDLIGAFLTFDLSSDTTTFEYSFTAASDGLFTFGGSANGTLGGSLFNFFTNGVFTSTGGFGVSGTTSEFLTETLIAGQDYTLSFVPFMGVSCGVDPTCFMSSRNENLNLNLSFNFQPVPIPPALWLFGTGLLGLIGIAKRKTA